MNSERINYLELEAKYSNCLDERNQLLERCLNSETMCETMSVQKTTLQRKLEDTQAALQELGSEHQSLQIQINKKSNYKWVDDSKVNNCEHCKKAFSVTIRKVKFRFLGLYKRYFIPNLFEIFCNFKHHCRNCGQIFCYECSSETATVSSSKKPQRVCKACFIEITNQ